MKELLRLELPGLPPTVNHMYRNHGHMRYKTAEGREYQERVSAKMAELWHNKAAYAGAVELRIEFTTNNRRKWDIDNRVKALQDCLEISGVLKNDRQIEVLHVERKYDSIMKTQIRLIQI